MRQLENWIESFIEYASIGEAPLHFYFWTAVSTIAGALQRRVYFDQLSYTWYPNHYIILVAPPAVVQKSTTAGLGMELLEQVPNVHMGPSSTSWQKLVEMICDECVDEYTDRKKMVMLEQRSMSVFVSELGNFIRAQDKEMLDQLVDLWDCKRLKRATVAHGKSYAENVCFNFIGCVTDEGISYIFPQYTLGGGFVSRVLWIWGDHKRQLVPYPRFQVIPERHWELKKLLIEDLKEIAHPDLNGEFGITPEAVAFGDEWYRRLYGSQDAHLREDVNFKAYISRKQCLIHKLAMVLAISEGNTLMIELSHLKAAEEHISALERNAGNIFNLMGRDNDSNHADRLVEFIRSRGVVTHAQAFEFLRGYFPRLNEFEEVMKGLQRAQLVEASGDARIKLGPRAVANE